MRLTHKHYLTLVLINSQSGISSKSSSSSDHGYINVRFPDNTIREYIKRK